MEFWFKFQVFQIESVSDRLYRSFNPFEANATIQRPEEKSGANFDAPNRADDRRNNGSPSLLTYFLHSYFPRGGCTCEVNQLVIYINNSTRKIVGIKYET